MRKLLAVKPISTSYVPYYEVTTASSFAEAKALIQQAEQLHSPFDDLDIPASDEAAFWSFLDWMRNTGRNYPFSMFGCKSTPHFIRLCQEARRKGFCVNT